MTRSITIDGGLDARRARTAAQRAWTIAVRAVVCGFGISAAYLGAYVLGAYSLDWDSDLASFFLLATPTLPLLSLAVGTGLLAARSPRRITRVVAGMTCCVIALLAFYVGYAAWWFTMTDWLVW